MIVGYARVSTEDQNLEAQLDALQAAGADRIFSDKLSGKLRNRPELDRALDLLRPDDVLVVTKYDRLARSLRDLLEIVETVQAKGAGFPLVAEDIDTTTSAGRLVFMFSHQSRNSSANASLSERAKVCTLPGGVVV
jgi:DNA invertase Pin-like site-specific DNA recombinase